MDSSKDAKTGPAVEALAEDQAVIGVLPDTYDLDQALGETPRQATLMEKPGHRMRSSAAMIRRRRRAFLTAFAVILLGCAAYAFSRPTLYRSEALLATGKIQTASEEATKKGPGKAADGDTNETLGTEATIFRTRAIAEALLDQMRLAGSAEFARDSQGIVATAVSDAKKFIEELIGSPPEEIPSAEKRERLVREILNRVTVRPQPDTNLLYAAMDAHEPKLAQNMLKNYIDIFVTQTLDRKRSEIAQAESWVKGELKKAEEKLKKSQAALAESSVRAEQLPTRDLLPDQLIAALNKTLEEFAGNMEERIQQEIARINTTRDVRPVNSDSRSGSLIGLREQLAELEFKYLKMSELYSDNYPPVVALRKQIQSIRSNIDDAERRLVHASAPGPAPPPASAPLQPPLPPVRIRPLELPQPDRARHDPPKDKSLPVKGAVDADQEIYNGLLRQHQALELSLQTAGSLISIVERPSLPIDPIGPHKALHLVIGSLLGLVGGALAALLAERRDSTLHSEDDIERFLHLRPLGTVPDVGKLKKFHKVAGGVSSYEVLAVEAPGTPVSEAVKGVKASLMAAVPESSVGSLVISSAGPKEGRTFLAVSLATTAGSEEKRALLVDADLRNPKIGALLGHREDVPGLTTLLTQHDVKLFEVLHRSQIPGFYYITSGPVPADPVALLESERMLEIVKRFKRMFDLVVFDTPPLFGFADSRIVAAHTDGLVLVVRQGHVPQQIIRQASDMVLSLGIKVLGAVINRGDAIAYLYGNKYFDYGGAYRGYFKDRERGRSARVLETPQKNNDR